jgi:hypothetical protein
MSPATAAAAAAALAAAIQSFSIRIDRHLYSAVIPAKQTANRPIQLLLHGGRPHRS